MIEAATMVLTRILCCLYKWAIAHPIQAIFNILSLLAPGAILGPLLKVFGLAGLGPVAGMLSNPYHLPSCFSLTSNPTWKMV